MIVGGVDPGKKGGLVTLDTDTGKLVQIMRVPLLPLKKKNSTKREVDYDSLGRYWGPVIRNCHRMYIEHVWGAAPNGRKQGGAGMFNFGYVAGVARGITIAHGIYYAMILPQKWKAKLGLLNTEKDASFAKVREMFPDSVMEFKRVTVDEGVAEAALIAAAGYQIEFADDNH